MSAPLEIAVMAHTATELRLNASKCRDGSQARRLLAIALVLEGCARPGSPAASARIQPVLRRSGPSRPSRNKPADAATRACVNNGLMRAFTSRNDDAHNSSIVSIEAAVIHTRPVPRDYSIINKKP